MTIPAAASLVIPGGFSIVAQIRPDAIPTASQAAVNQAFNKYLYSATTQAGCQANVPMGGFSEATVAHEVCAATPLQTNVYSCVAVTYNGTELALYVNKTKVGTAAKTHELPAMITPQAIRVGANPTPASFFNGQLDELWLYNYRD